MNSYEFYHLLGYEYPASKYPEFMAWHLNDLNVVTNFNLYTVLLITILEMKAIQNLTNQFSEMSITGQLDKKASQDLSIFESWQYGYYRNQQTDQVSPWYRLSL